MTPPAIAVAPKPIQPVLFPCRMACAAALEPSIPAAAPTESSSRFLLLTPSAPPGFERTRCERRRTCARKGLLFLRFLRALERLRRLRVRRRGLATISTSPGLRRARRRELRDSLRLCGLETRSLRTFSMNESLCSELEFVEFAAKVGVIGPKKPKPQPWTCFHVWGAKKIRERPITSVSMGLVSFLSQAPRQLFFHSHDIRTYMTF